MDPLSRPAAEARSISQLVELARQGMLRIPPFQRSFRWRARDIERLFDSVRRGYPIGSILLWERDAPAAHVHFGPFEVDAPDVRSALWVVDGQQRLTSLIGVLAAPQQPGAEFDVYYDLGSERFVRAGARRPQMDWVPLRRVVGTNDFLDWLLDFKERGATGAQVAAATELGNLLREYTLPVSVVRNATEQEMRDIFDRLNSYGRRLRTAEVFQSLHAAIGGAEPADLRALVDEVHDLGFGALPEDTVLRAVLSVRGGDPYRDFRGEFGPDEDPAAAFAATSRALRHTVDFLQSECGVPHLRVLPYVYAVPALARFFSLHERASPRSRLLLRRWLWRDAAAGRSGGSGTAPVLRRAVRAIDRDEDASVQRLLSATVRGRFDPDLTASRLNQAAARMNLALLAQLRPRDLVTEEEVDLPELLDSREGLLRLTGEAEGGDSLATVFLHPPIRDDEVDEVLAAATPTARASHVLAVDGTLALGDLLRLRERALPSVLRDRYVRLAEPDANDRPALAALLVPDESE